MRVLPLHVVLAAGALGLAIASCGGGRDVFPEAESLEKAGKLEEAAAKLHLVCPLAPGGPRGGGAGGPAFAARGRPAEWEWARVLFLASYRLFRQAVLTGDEPGAKRVVE